MTQYVLVEEGVITKFNLPSVGKLKNGRQVSNYDLLPEETLAAEGWLPVIDSGPPDYDPDTQQVIHGGYEVLADRVEAQYTVSELPSPPPPEPDYEAEFVAAVEAATNLTELKAALIGKSGKGPGAQPKKDRN